MNCFCLIVPICWCVVPCSLPFFKKEVSKFCCSLCDTLYGLKRLLLRIHNLQHLFQLYCIQWVGPILDWNAEFDGIVGDEGDQVGLKSQNKFIRAHNTFFSRSSSPSLLIGRWNEILTWRWRTIYKMCDAFSVFLVTLYQEVYAVYCCFLRPLLSFLPLFPFLPFPFPPLLFFCCFSFPLWRRGFLLSACLRSTRSKRGEVDPGFSVVQYLTSLP